MTAKITNKILSLGSQQIEFPTSLTPGANVTITVGAQNLGDPAALAIEWVVSTPDGNPTLHYKTQIADYLIRTNGKHYFAGPVLVLDTEGQWNINIALFTSEGNVIQTDSYNGPLVYVGNAISKETSTIPKPAGIPHPEESMNPSATLTNINVNEIINKWLTGWEVPNEHWTYWKSTIDLQVYAIYPASLIAMGLKPDTPAGTWESGGRRHLAIKPQWLNPGVIAHEQAHNSYALLTSDQKVGYSNVYSTLKNSDPTIRLLYSKNQYGLTNDVEGHAEVYRYIGQWMPEQLKIFYPRLL